ncbi:hypothetical protein INR49_003843 [Caranx melampygus]|nr:hypothetical protein INR49_003843 [Caranx melampygus]
MHFNLRGMEREEIWMRRTGRGTNSSGRTTRRLSSNMNSKMRRYGTLPPISSEEKSLVGNLKPTPPSQPRHSMAMTDEDDAVQINTITDLTARRHQMKKEGETLRQKVQCQNFQRQLRERFNEEEQQVQEERVRYLRLKEIAEKTRMELRYIGIPEKYLRDPMPYPKPRPELFQNLSPEFELRLPPLPSISRTSSASSCTRRPPSAKTDRSYTILPPISRFFVGLSRTEAVR